MRARGQMVVEFALVYPVLLLLLLAMVGVFYLDINHDRFQNGVTVLAELASDGTEDWRSRVADENAATACNANPLMPETIYLDGGSEDGDRLRLVWHCHLSTRWVFDGLPVTVSWEVVIRPEPTQGATP